MAEDEARPMELDPLASVVAEEEERLVEENAAAVQIPIVNIVSFFLKKNCLIF